MKQFQRVAFIIVVAVLLAFVALFPLLTLDAVSKLMTRVAQMEPGNFLLILYLELSRAFTTIIAFVTAVILVIRSSRNADGRSLALFLIFIALTYEKISAVTVYPGPLQVKMVTAMLDAGFSRASLTWLFGPVPWTFWFALAALLRFSVVFPNPPLSAEAIDASGLHDRRGMMRGSGVAGADIGAAFRNVAKKALALGAFKPIPLYTAATVMAAVTTVTSAATRIMLLSIAALLAVALAVTNLRASYNIVVEDERRRARWLLLGFATGGAIFMIASLPLLFFDNTMANVPALMLLMLAPATIMICMAMGVLYRGSMDAELLLKRLPETAAFVLAVLLLFAVTTSLLTRLTGGTQMSAALALLGAVIITAFSLTPLRRLSERAMARVLERQ